MIFTERYAISLIKNLEGVIMLRIICSHFLDDRLCLLVREDDSAVLLAPDRFNNEVWSTACTCGDCFSDQHLEEIGVFAAERSIKKIISDSNNYAGPPDDVEWQTVSYRNMEYEEWRAQTVHNLEFLKLWSQV